MCGISGIINFSKNINNADINVMNNSINYRGPNFKKIIKLNYASLGFLRLSIIDLSNKSNQPFQDTQKKITVIYNGEIYNYKDLKKKFFSKIKFKSNGDGEIILHLYQKFGKKFINYLKGMFAICIVDENKKNILLIRDRFGIKPLYYFLDKKNKNLIFCSEIKGIVATRYYKKSINMKEAYLYLQKGYINSTNESWFKDIYQVPPGSYIEYNPLKLVINNYYKLEEKIDESKDNSNISYKKILNNIFNKICNSFNDHLQFDVKAGIHISSGTDSALIAALTKIHNSKNIESYTFSFENKKFSELDGAKEIAKSVNLKNNSSILKDKDVEDFLYDVLKAEFEPFSSLRILSQHHLYKKYKNNIKVVIDGSGGDEIGAGYIYYVIPWYLDLLNDNKVSKEQERLLNLSKNIKNDTIDLQHFLLGSINQTFSPGSSTVDGSIYSNKSLLNNDFLKSNNQNDFKIVKPFKSYLRNAQYADLFHLKLPRALRYVDRASMSNSIEARVPLLDHEVVEACFNVPSRFKIVNQQQRSIFKDNIKKHIKNVILFKNKRTIADPQSYWLKNNLKNLCDEVFYDSNFDSYNFLNKEKFREYYQSFIKYPKHFNTFFIFQILIMELWIKKILN
jgi:asparagine synthase (glutamine-hydrolysing)